MSGRIWNADGEIALDFDTPCACSAEDHRHENGWCGTLPTSRKMGRDWICEVCYTDLTGSTPAEATLTLHRIRVDRLTDWNQIVQRPTVLVETVSEDFGTRKFSSGTTLAPSQYRTFVDGEMRVSGPPNRIGVPLRVRLWEVL